MALVTSVVGIDIGTEKCVVAVARKRGIEVLQNEVGHRATPAMVGFNGNERNIGNQAMMNYSSNARNTVTNIKRYLGRKFDDPDVQSEPATPTKIVKTADGGIAFEIDYSDSTQLFTPEQITGALLTKLKFIAEKNLEYAVNDVVLSCPYWWTDAQRRALLDAAQIAGLNVLRLLNENTAVALQYGIMRQLPKDTPQKTMFVDIGFSHMEASIVSFVDGKLNVLSNAGDHHLGARNFDQVLVNHFAAYIKDKYKMDVLSNAKATMKLSKECTRVKNMLSANSKVPFNVEYIMNDRDVSGMIERQEFENVISETLIPRIVAVLQKALDQSGLKKEDLFSLEIVGGATRIPIVQKAITQWFGREVSKTCDGDESVARGCALMCAMLSPAFKVREFDVQDIYPYAVELQWGSQKGDAFTKEDTTPLLAVNNALPNVKIISFSDRSEALDLIVNYSDPGTLPSPAINPIIGRFKVHGFPSKNPNQKAAKIKVKAKLTRSGTVEVCNAQLLEDIEVEEEVPVAQPAKPAEQKAEEKKDEATMQDEKPAEATADAAKMDTTPDAAQAAAPAVEKKKKITTIRHELLVDHHYTSGIGAKQLSLYHEKEVAMIQQDKTIAEIGEAKNALEAYCLEMRNRVTEGDLAPFAKPAERDTLCEALAREHEWLEGDGWDSTKSEYTKRLDGLKKFGNPIVFRHLEVGKRGEAETFLRQTIQQYRILVSSTEEKYSHITADERAKVTQELNTVEAWLNDSLARQKAAPLHENPVITSEQIYQKRASLDASSAGVFNKPKPKPEPKKEEPKKEEAKPAEPKPEEPKAEEPKQEEPKKEAADEPMKE